MGKQFSGDWLLKDWESLWWSRLLLGLLFINKILDYLHPGELNINKLNLCA